MAQPMPSFSCRRAATLLPLAFAASAAWAAGAAAVPAHRHAASQAVPRPPAMHVLVAAIGDEQQVFDRLVADLSRRLEGRDVASVATASASGRIGRRLDAPSDVYAAIRSLRAGRPGGCFVYLTGHGTRAGMAMPLSAGAAGVARAVASAGAAPGTGASGAASATGAADAARAAASAGAARGAGVAGAAGAADTVGATAAASAARELSGTSRAAAPRRYASLSWRDVRAALDDGCGDAPTVVVFSACYSGVYVRPGLTRPNRIVLTAAAADRTSFGCGDDLTHTYYDGCFLRSFDAAATWRRLAARTASCVARLERALLPGAPPSRPQAALGRAVRDLPLPSPRAARPPHAAAS